MKKIFIFIGVAVVILFLFWLGIGQALNSTTAVPPASGENLSGALRPSTTSAKTAVSPAGQAPALKEPAGQPAASGTQVCHSNFADAVGNTNNTRLPYRPLPGDEYMCTPNGWVHISH